MMSGLLTESQILSIVQGCCSLAREPRSDDPAAVLSSWLPDIHAALSQHNFALKKMVDPDSHETVYAFVNNSQDEHAKLATNYSASEMALLRLIVTLIMEGGEDEQSAKTYRISSLKAIQAARANQQLSMNSMAAENAIRQFVRDGWLRQTRAGKLGLAPRLLLELETYLLETFEDVVELCRRCEKIFTAGQRCTDSDCGAVLHSHCANALFTKSSQPKCPACSKSWPFRKGLNEEVHQEDEDVSSSRPQRSTTPNKRRITDEDDDDE